MKVNSRIELEFAGVSLPIGKDAEGRDIVPLKPISDVFGLSWADVKKKIGAVRPTCGGDIPSAGSEKQPDSRDASPYLGRLFGVCMGLMYHAGQLREMLCIRLDRVAAWMMQINPERVRAAGNESGAAFLEQKHEEWADLLHEYETRQGGMLQAISGETRTRAINIRLYLSVLRAKHDTADEADRAALTVIAKTLAADAGAPYQADLIA